MQIPWEMGSSHGRTDERVAVVCMVPKSHTVGFLLGDDLYWSQRSISTVLVSLERQPCSVIPCPQRLMPGAPPPLVFGHREESSIRRVKIEREKQTVFAAAV